MPKRKVSSANGGSENEKFVKNVANYDEGIVATELAMLRQSVDFAGKGSNGEVTSKAATACAHCQKACNSHNSATCSKVSCRAVYHVNCAVKALENLLRQRPDIKRETVLCPSCAMQQDNLNQVIKKHVSSNEFDSLSNPNIAITINFKHNVTQADIEKISRILSESVSNQDSLVEQTKFIESIVEKKPKK